MESIVTQPESTFLHFSSEYGVRRGADTNDMIFTLPRAINAENPNYAMMIGIASMTIPHLWYNMYGVNWSILVYNGGSGTVVTGSIPYQNYNVSQLTLALVVSINAALTAAGLPSSFNVVYNAQTSKLTFTYVAYNFSFIPIADNCYFELGMSGLSTGLISLISSQSNTLISPGAVDLSSFHGIYVCMPQIRPTIASYSQFSLAPVLARVPIRSTFTAVETYEPAFVQYRLIGDDNLRELHITLRGDDGSPLVLNGCNWTITFHVKFVLKELLEQPNNFGNLTLPQGVQFFPGRSAVAQGSSNLYTTGM